MWHETFVEQVIDKIRDQPGMIGLAVGGSWITGELDAYSDLDLVLVTEHKIGGDEQQMKAIAATFGHLLNSFNGLHVGELRLLICMYENSLRHVDIKFVTLEEFQDRVEDPVILWEKNQALTEVIHLYPSQWPTVDYQWIEDRFWTWIHYLSLKLGRGEHMEVVDGLSYIRVHVIAPLMQLKNGQLPRGLRKAEINWIPADLEAMKATIPQYSPRSLCDAVEKNIELYLRLSKLLYPPSVQRNEHLKALSIDYFHDIRRQLEEV